MMEKNAILTKLEGLAERFEAVSTLITEAEVIADQKRFIQLSKEYKELGNILRARNDYLQTINGIEESKNILSTETDPELTDLAQEE
ncbi:MAG: PCRF domain-containing protein, partial [Tannerella sp.]|nr:PCRF domain-containing protein [Tannerella sp.]